MTESVDFLVDQVCSAVTLEPDSGAWVFRFSDGSTLRAECYLRLISNGRISVTGTDHGQRFGLAEPVDASDRIRSELGDAKVSAASLAPETSDLTLTFANGSRLEILTASSGYESWHLCRPNGGELIVGGGGERFVQG